MIWYQNLREILNKKKLLAVYASQEEEDNLSILMGLDNPLKDNLGFKENWDH